MNILIHFTDIPLSSRGGFTFVYERYLKEKKKGYTKEKTTLLCLCVAYGRKWHAIDRKLVSLHDCEALCACLCGFSGNRLQQK